MSHESSFELNCSSSAHLRIHTQRQVEQSQALLIHHEGHILAVDVGLLLGDGLVDVEVSLVMPGPE